MPKISKTRIINLNYNDNKRTINDELFNYGNGENTLFSMDNGLGKTVLIQFFLQPFLRNKRDIAGRNFEDYFNRGETTYIMHEMLLDNSDKLLIGMVIKKEISEEEQEKLRIIAFTHKYSHQNDYDIVSIPFVEHQVIKKFSEAEVLLKDLSRRLTYFEYYSFNNHKRKSKYFEDLNNYNINYNEWENIIKKINNDESGLSKLFDDYNSDEALLRGQIIPIIETKLNNDSNRIQDIKTTVHQFTENYKNHKENINKLLIYRTFMAEFTPFIEKLNDGEKLLSDRNKLFSDLSLSNQQMNQLNETYEAKKIELLNKIEDLNNNLNLIDYERLSYEFYNYEVKEEEITELLAQIESKKTKLENDYNNLRRTKYLLQASEIYQNLVKEQRDLENTKEQIKNKEKDDSEIAQSIRDYRYNLNRLYHQELNVLQDNEENINTMIIDLENNETQKHAEKIRVFNLIQDNIRKSEQYKYSIDNFHKFESKIQKKYPDFTLTRNILFDEYDEVELNTFLKSIEQSIIQTTKDIELIQVEKQENIRKITTIEDEISEIEVKKNETEQKLRYIESDLKIFNEKSQKLHHIFLSKGIEPDIYNHKQTLLDLIVEEIARANEDLIQIEGLINEKTKLIDMYQTGHIEFPKEIIADLKKQGISYETGLHFLQNFRGTMEEKRKILEMNPFFPYSMIFKDEDYKEIEDLLLSEYTSNPIPITSINFTNQNSPYHNKNIVKLDQQDFIIAFNPLLLDEETRKLEINKLQEDLIQLNKQKHQLKALIEGNQKYKLIIEDYPYIGNENIKLDKDIKELSANIEQGKTEILRLKVEIKNIGQRNEVIEQEIINYNNKLRNLKEKEANFTDFIEEHQAYKQHLVELKNCMDEEKRLNDSHRSLEEDIKNIRVKISNYKIQLSELENQLKDYRNRLLTVKDVVNGNLIDLDINTLEAKLEASVKNLNNDLRILNEKKSRSLDRIEQDRKTLNRYIDEGNLNDEYKDINFSDHRLAEVNRDIKNHEKTIKDTTVEFQNIDKEKIRINTIKINKLKDIEKMGYYEPIDKKKITDVNFDKRIDELNKIKYETKKRITKYEDLTKRLVPVLNKLEKFDEISSDIVVIDFDNLDRAISLIENYMTSYDKVLSGIDKTEQDLSISLNKIYEDYREKDQLIKSRLSDIKIKGHILAYSEDIKSFIDWIDRLIKKMDLELELFNEEENTVLDNVIRYCKDVLNELQTIDNNSRLKLPNKTQSQKLMEVIIPDHIEEEAVRDYIRLIVRESADLENPQSKLDLEITTGELLSKYIGHINKVSIIIKKIETNRVVSKTWKQTITQNSGGEKFVSMFILLASLMTYTRKKETDIGTSDSAKILIMDNPFAKLQSEHLLTPMFDIADKYKIQLICFSGISGQNIYNQFNQIFTAKPIYDQYRNKENLVFSQSNNHLEFTDFTFTQESLF